MEGFEKVITRRKLITFTFRKGRLREVEEKELKTVDIRLTKDNKSVFCSGTDEEDCLKRAKKMLKHVKRVEFFGLPSPSKYEKVKLFDERILGGLLERGGRGEAQERHLIREPYHPET